MRQRQDESQERDTLHASERLREEAGSEVMSIVKRCGCCGRSYDRAGWSQLSFLHTQVIEADGETGAPVELHEVRNCVCNSTIMADVRVLMTDEEKKEGVWTIRCRT